MTDNYSTNKNHISIIEQCNIWLVNKNGDVLIKNYIHYPDPLNSSAVTLVAENLNQLIKSIENQWGIISFDENFKDNIEQVSYFENDSMKLTTYMLKLDLGKKSRELICEKFNGIFLNYRSLDNKLKYPKVRTDDFWESFLALIQHLDSMYGLSSYLPNRESN